MKSVRRVVELRGLKKRRRGVTHIRSVQHPQVTRRRRLARDGTLEHLELLTDRRASLDPVVDARRDDLDDSNTRVSGLTGADAIY